jgi:nucleoside-diphosphate-sugar epimerase
VSPLANLGGDVRIVPGSVVDPSSLAPFFADSTGATLFHVAGIIHPSVTTRQLYRVNRDGTENVMRAAIAAGVRRVVHVSSNSPIGTSASPEQTFDEASPYRPYMKYGHSKMLAEQIVLGAARGGAIETVVVRPPWFYGPGQPARQSRFIAMVKAGRVPIVGSGENRRSMAYIDNICQGLLLCESHDSANGQTYWIADRRPYTMNEIVDTIERLLEMEFGLTVAHRRMKVPPFVSDVARLADWLFQSVGLYQQEIHVLSEMNRTIACSIDKACRELGYSPRIELEEGMRRSIAWALSNAALTADEERWRPPPNSIW